VAGNGSVAPEPEARRWQQQAGFSVFFDTAPPGPNEETGWRTRLYHEETGDETTFGVEALDTIIGSSPSAGWTRWILDRLRTAAAPAGPVDPSPSTVSMVSMQIIDARLVDDRPVTGGSDVWVELHLRVKGMADLNKALGAEVVGVVFGLERP
jgi:hypothetical protein